MRPRWINPPKIEKGDPQIPLIEQIDEMYWEPHDMRLRHCYILSKWYMEFRGELFDFRIKPDYLSSNCDINDESIYTSCYGQERAVDKGERWNPGIPELYAVMACLQNTTYIGIGDHHFDLVGSIYMQCKLIRLRPKNISGFESVLDKENLKRYSFERSQNTIPDYEISVFPKSVDDIEERIFKNRVWMHARHGYDETSLDHDLYTALDDQHIVSVNYKPKFWPQDCTEISQKAYEISLTPLWDFMENLTIAEINENEGKTYLAGKVEPDNKETFKHPGQDDESSAW